MEESFDKQSHAEITVYRDEWNEIVDDVDPLVDEFYIEDENKSGSIFGGRLTDVKRGGVQIELILGSFETDARQGEPVQDTVVFDNSPDSLVVSSALERTDTLSAGQIQNVGHEMSIMFSKTSPAKMIRDTTEMTGGEVRYNPDKTVDYKHRLGSDKLDIIGPTNQTVTEEFAATQVTQERPTHLLMLGAGEGDAQLQTTSVAPWYDDSVPRQNWIKRANKEITNERRLQRVADHAMAEYNESPQYIEIEIETFDLQISLGDTFPVIYEEEDINTRLRVMELTTNYSSEGVTHEATLSNRRFTRASNPGQNTRETAAQFQESFQGSTVPISTTGGRQPVSNDLNYEMSVDYPSDVQKEMRAKLHVRGLPYRAYSQGVSAGGGGILSETSGDNADFESVVDSQIDSVFQGTDNAWQEIGSFTTDEDTSMLFVSVRAQREGTTGSDDLGGTYIRLHDQGDDRFYPRHLGSQISPQENDTVSRTLLIPKNVNGDDIILQARYSGEDSTTNIGFESDWVAVGQHNHEIELELNEHSHDVKPGIIEFDEYPSRCDVRVNGESHEVSLGDGSNEFEETVDISDRLDEGFNEIEVTSETLGHLDVTCALDVYRQIRGE
ncbi:hypothetical protein C497_05667 [Halalkalicoccus jeotgali B3]|uniref:Tail spike domain-containing protein n=2 Tax=Halalkalicoccus jeotgali TaxID=413810 RepID=D8JAW4_HALJB|nr:hypothetical protein HacjB3_07255 [Halalkalicoccus jeotgali B3]ELY39419.1 hypothetical protein C497_05667 [Halalkalicoccus jeotgali B3]